MPANDTIDAPADATPIVAELVPDLSGATEEVGRSSPQGIADAVLDASASVAVARHLARDTDSSARRISPFFNLDRHRLALCSGEDSSPRAAPRLVRDVSTSRELINNPALARPSAPVPSVRGPVRPVLPGT